MTAPPEQLKIGGVWYPLRATDNDALASGVSVLRAVDPGCYYLLRYFERVLNWAIGTGIADVVPPSPGAPLGTAVRQTTNVDPMVWLHANTWRWPLLALYPVSEEPARDRTAVWSQTTTLYKLAYLLPPMTADQAERGFALLTAARRVLVLATESHGVLDIDSGGNPLSDAGVNTVEFNKAEYGVLQSSDGALSYPSLLADVVVQYREQADDEQGVASAYSQLVVDSLDGADVIGVDTAAFTVTSRSDVG